MRLPFNIFTGPNGKKEGGVSSVRKKKNEIGLSGLEGLGEVS